MLRKPAVAGRFYPADQKSLNEQLSTFLQSPDNAAQTQPIAVMVPHAGYVYSGAIAGATFRSIDIPPQVVILNPNHTGLGVPVSVADFESWETPLGPVAVDRDLAESFVAECQLAKFDTDAHLREHAAEVQVPFLQYLRANVKILPITIGALSVDACAQVGEALLKTIRNVADSTPVLVVCSSDMTHYESAKNAEKKDKKALDRILALDGPGLYETVRSEKISMCGVIPATVMLAFAKNAGAQEARLVRYANSGDANGDYHSVVGYAGVILT